MVQPEISLEGENQLTPKKLTSFRLANGANKICNLFQCNGFCNNQLQDLYFVVRWNQTPLNEAYKSKNQAVADFIYKFCAPKEQKEVDDNTEEIVFKAIYSAATGDVENLRKCVIQAAYMHIYHVYCNVTEHTLQHIR